MHACTDTNQRKCMDTVSSPASFSHLHQLGSQNQDLMEQNLILREQMTQFEQHTTDDGLRLQRRLMAELGLCFSELQSLVQVCLQRARGEDPNMSVLLGVTGQCQAGWGGGHRSVSKVDRGGGISGLQSLVQVWLQRACGEDPQHLRPAGGHRSVSVRGWEG